MLCTVPARKLNLSSHLAPNQAVDNRDPDRPVFFNTEDIEYGPLRSFEANDKGFDALHAWRLGKRCAADAQHGTRRVREPGEDRPPRASSRPTLG